jgi:hypothetical protein
MEPGPVVHDSKMGLRLEQLIYHGFSDLERPSAWRKLSNRKPEAIRVLRRD